MPFELPNIREKADEVIAAVPTTPDEAREALSATWGTVREQARPGQVLLGFVVALALSLRRMPAPTARHQPPSTDPRALTARLPRAPTHARQAPITITPLIVSRHRLLCYQTSL